MAAIHALMARREAKAALAVWVLLPTLFLFFALTLAVDPSTQLGKVRLGVAVLDAGVDTPQGHMSIGGKLIEGLGGQLPFQISQYGSESELREAVLAHEVSGGIIFPADMSQKLVAQQPIQMQVVKSDANDAFSNAFITNLPTQIAGNLNAALPQLLGGQATPPLVTVAVNNVAPTSDFRFGTIPATLILPFWIATLAFAALLSRAAASVRETMGAGGLLVELGVSVVGAAVIAAVITLDIALFTWRWDLDFVGLFGFMWLGLVASAWLLQGTIRLLGFEIGVPLGVLGLFVQQPVSGAGFPPAFAPDVVRWLTDLSPLRYVVEGLRNLLIGGSTTGDMALALGLIALSGLALFAAGAARVLLTGQRRQQQPAASL